MGDTPGDGGRTGGGPGAGYRDYIRDLRADLNAIRRDLRDASAVARENSGLLAENLPRLDTLESTVGGLRGQVQALTDHPRPHPGPGPAGDRTSDGSGSGGDGAGAAAAVGDDLYALGGPGVALCWATLDADTAAMVWDSLARWVAHVLTPWYRPTRAQLPDCWPVHPRAVAELTWLHQCYRDAVHPEAKPHLAADWHTRWLPAVLPEPAPRDSGQRSRRTTLTGLGAAIDPTECLPGWHRMTKQARSEETDTEAADAEAARARREPTEQPAAPGGAFTTPGHGRGAGEDEYAQRRRQRVTERRGDPSAGRPRHVAALEEPQHVADDEHGWGREPSAPWMWINYYRAAADEDIAHRRSHGLAPPPTSSWPSTARSTRGGPPTRHPPPDGGDHRPWPCPGFSRPRREASGGDPVASAGSAPPAPGPGGVHARCPALTVPGVVWLPSGRRRDGITTTPPPTHPHRRALGEFTPDPGSEAPPGGTAGGAPASGRLSSVPRLIVSG